jgi:hypothetical protein
LTRNSFGRTSRRNIDDIKADDWVYYLNGVGRQETSLVSACICSHHAKTAPKLQHDQASLQSAHGT